MSFIASALTERKRLSRRRLIAVFAESRQTFIKKELELAKAERGL